MTKHNYHYFFEAEPYNIYKYCFNLVRSKNNLKTLKT